MWINRPERSARTWQLCPVVMCFPEYSSGASDQDQHGRSVPSMTAVVPRSAASTSGCSSSITTLSIASTDAIVRDTVD
ncbi:hypothetical protein C5C18_15105 [Rathayibacter tritici]|nr:hypothetical protein C5C18_15105 [Rathayibacter tritici]